MAPERRMEVRSAADAADAPELQQAADSADWAAQLRAAGALSALELAQLLGATGVPPAAAPDRPRLLRSHAPPAPPGLPQRGPQVWSVGTDLPAVVIPARVAKGAPQAAPEDPDDPIVVVICPECSHEQPKTWEGFDPVAEMECEGCGKMLSGWTPVQQAEEEPTEEDIEELPPVLRGWARCCWRDFEVNWAHVQKEIPLARKVDQIRGVRAAQLLDILDKTTIPDSELEMWVNHDGRRLFHSKRDVREALSTITAYIDDGTCKSDAGDRLRCIILLMREEKSGSFDIPRLLLALAQNGNLCHVQKEVGIRSVYGSMTGTGKAEADSRSAENLLLQGFAALREALVDAQAAKVCNRHECGIPADWKQHATHFLVPVRNAYHKMSGLPYMPDLRRIDGGRSEFENVRGITDEHRQRWFSEFAASYSPWQIHWCAEESINAKKVPYEATQAWFQDHAPAGVDSYTFRAEFVFNMDTGKVTKKAVYYLLCGMGVLQGTAGATWLVEEEKDIRGQFEAMWKEMWKGWDRTVEEEAQVRWKVGQEYDKAHAALFETEEAKVCLQFNVRRKQMEQVKKQTGSAASREAQAKAASKRMQVEKKKQEKSGCPAGLTLRSDDDLLLEWNGTIQGPPGSPYEGGSFVFTATIPPDYPRSAPQVRMQTKMHHPQIDAQGRPALPMLSAWAAKYTLLETVTALQELLANPIFDTEGGRASDDEVAAWRKEARKLTESEAM
eukprot:TRINITY_DN50251_c0_g1_i1.p1 TRINITY_DN50251_c0_g1~~TRINITY_DN50251_c0_g1_i1.p1  ORF type:complete len:756 (+),score=270.02 TRINITY_DN50251_c0_g1_i1:86-2269(+)